MLLPRHVFLVALPCLLLLVGCQTTEERVAADDKQCQTYGVQPGSPGYVQCRLQLDRQHANQRLLESTSPVGFTVDGTEIRQAAQGVVPESRQGNDHDSHAARRFRRALGRKKRLV